MKKEEIKISSPDELNKHIQQTSPITWILLGMTIILLVAFFAWSMIFKIKIKLTGKAHITSGEVTLTIKDSDLNKLKIGQKVYIENLEGEIVSFLDEQPVVSSFSLNDGEYTYSLVLKEAKPIDFLLGK